MLRRLDKVTFNRFQRLVHSPYFNRNTDLQAFVDYLETQHPEFTDEACARDAVHAALFGERAPFKDTRIRLLFSELCKLLERFLSIEAFQEDERALDLRLLEQLRALGLPKLYAEHWRKAQRKYDAQWAQSDQAQLQTLAFSMETARRPDTAYERQTDDFLQQWSDQLDQYFLQQKLKLSAGLLNTQQIFGNDAHLGLLPDALAHLNAHPDNPYGPAVQLYQQLVILLQQPENEQTYEALKALFLSEHTLVHPDDQRQLHAALRNHCVRRINAGESRFLQELFEWYKHGLESGLLLSEGVLSPWEFKNIVSLALRLGELSWGERFIGAFSEKVPAPYSENVHAFSMARLDFARQNYRSALQRLQTVAFDDPFYSLDARTLQAKAYYERTDFEPLAALLESFRRLISRNKALSEQHKTAYGNFIKTMKRLIKLKPNDHAHLQQLSAAIQSEAHLPDKRWFVQKISELGAPTQEANA
ncbi:MAG: hypothetical protein ACOCZ8_01620 [Bacteroidota bacterium]